MAEAVREEPLRSVVAVPVAENQEEQFNDYPHKVVLFFCISSLILVADIATDVIVFIDYWMVDNIRWALSTLLVIVAPMIVVHVFSLRWFINDSTVSILNWITHFSLVGLFYRHAALMRMMLMHKLKSPRLWQHQIADLHLLNLLRSFLQSAPQVALQSYCCIEAQHCTIVKGVSLAISVISVLWSGLVYERSMRQNICCVAFLVRSTWYCAMLAARLAAILLFSVVFGLWTLVPLGIHWAAMTVWIISQKTEFCPTKLEEMLYNVVIGFVYCFCYFNLREGRTRYRLVTFCTFMVTQNMASLLLFVLATDLERQRKPWAVIATISIIAGTVIGLCSMISYYRWFHPKGPIKWKNAIDDDVELNNKDPSSPSVRQLNTDIAFANPVNRTLKTFTKISEVRPGVSNPQVSQQPDVGNTDKKYLLDHWIARSGTPTFISAPVGKTAADFEIEFRTVENTPQANATTSDTVHKSKVNRKKQGIYSPTELNLKLSSIEHMESSIDDLTSSNLAIQKRRGICSSDELKDDLQLDEQEQNRLGEKSQKSIDRGSELSHDTDSSNKKTSSDSIDMDLELSFSDINSSDINEFNENIVQKLCLSTLKNIKVGNQDADIQNIQRIALDILKEMYAKKGKHRKIKGQDTFIALKRELDTPTEVLSVHDYENICAVNIAREAWGLRSWNVYSDIENWQHDGSVVRDRRRDTLTSASSEISSCISQELRSQIMSAVSLPRAPTYSNVFVHRQPLEEYPSEIGLREDNNLSRDNGELSTYSAKPCLIDNTVSHLEPILEENDGFGDIDQPSKQRLNSESSLVATIDEIRKGTITNSPRNVYHCRENEWDSPQMNSQPKIETSLKRALWKEPSKFNPSNILESLPEKGNSGEFNESKFSPQKSSIPDVFQASGAVINVPKAVLRNCTKNSRSQKMTNLKTQMKKNNTKSEEMHDLSNKDIDFLWQLVSDNTLPIQINSTEDLCASNITSSLQSLIQKDNVTAPVVNVSVTAHKLNIKKNGRNRPRRKFSLLREHFEPKLAKVGDEESLYAHSNKNSQLPREPVFGVRFQNRLSQSQVCLQMENTNGSEDILEAPGHSSPKNIKEKRSLFLKQVLSPPKFNTKNKA